MLGQAVGSAKIEEPVEPGLSERGVVAGIEDYDDLETRLEKLIVDSRGADSHPRRDLARPQRYDRRDVCAVFEAKYRDSPVAAARELGWIEKSQPALGCGLGSGDRRAPDGALEVTNRRLRAFDSVGRRQAPVKRQ